MLAAAGSWRDGSTAHAAPACSQHALSWSGGHGMQMLDVYSMDEEGVADAGAPFR